jgi:hypothetical protein
MEFCPDRGRRQLVQKCNSLECPVTVSGKETVGRWAADVTETRSVRNQETAKVFLLVEKDSKSRVARRKRPRNSHSMKKPSAPMQTTLNGGGEVVLYEAADGKVELEVRLERETVWLTQAQMAELFGRERSVITKHVRGVFREGELEAKSVCANFARTAEDGKTYQVDHFQWVTA